MDISVLIYTKLRVISVQEERHKINDPSLKSCEINKIQIRGVRHLSWSMATETGARLENVVFRFDKSQPPVLDNVTINLPRGSIYCLLGSSGCGKTTLIKVR